MKRTVLIGRARLLAAAALTASLGAVRAVGVESNPPTSAQVARLETGLQRGISTKADVERLLGPAAGQGESELPGDTVRRIVWYYGATEAINEWTKYGAIKAAITERRTLLIFFDGDLYTGFLWIAYPAP
jgi:hypothetical protein